MLRAYAQLLRLPNVFTLWADVALVVLIAQYQGDGRPDVGWLALILRAALPATLLYFSGMVLNDCFDAAEDLRDRPQRPIPSGRISLGAAGWLGLSLLLAGPGLLLLTSGLAGGTLEYGLMLAALIVLYNSWLKQTWLGPVGMGGCRFLNILLVSRVCGVSANWPWHVAAVVGIYIAGVTCFARKEAEHSDPSDLAIGAFVMLLAALIGALLPGHLDVSFKDPLPLLALAGLWFVLFAFVRKAQQTLEPRDVQRAVKACLLGLIGLDAALAFTIVGWPGLLILAFLPPALVLGRWVYST